MEAGTKIYPTSKPTIEKALLNGHCLDGKLAELITDYFTGKYSDEVRLSNQLSSDF